MPSVAVIGDRERVAGFAALGLDGYPAHTRAEAETALEKAQRAGCTDFGDGRSGAPGERAP